MTDIPPRLRRLAEDWPTLSYYERCRALQQLVVDAAKQRPTAEIIPLRSVDLQPCDCGEIDG